MRRAGLLLLLVCLVIASGPVSVAALSHVSVSLTNSKAGMVSGYTISFQPGVGSELSPGDEVDLFFDPRVELPAGIAVDNVLVNGVAALAVSVQPLYSRMTVEVPEELAAGVTATITISAAAGITNPMDVGAYELGLRTTAEQTIVWTGYSLTGSSVTRTSVSVNPALPGVRAEYQVRLRPETELVAGEDLVRIQFPEAVTLPASIGKASVTVDGVQLAEDPTLVGRVLTMVVPVVLRTDRTATVVIAEAASVRNPAAAGTYSVGISTSQDPVVVSASFQVSSAVSQPTVTISPATAQVAAAYTVVFTTSTVGALTGGTGTISIDFPQGTTIPSAIGNSTITVNGTKLNTGSVSRSGTEITFTVPTGVSVASSRQVTVVIAATAGIKNPPADNYTLAVRTSSDQRWVESRVYQIRSGAVTNVSVTVSPPAVGTVAEYRVGFRTSATGNLIGGEDTITIGFPVGTTVPSSISRSHLLVDDRMLNTGTVSVDGREITFRLPTTVDVGNSSSVSVVIRAEAGIKNPTTAGNAYKLTVSTSRDGEGVASPAYSIYGGKVTGVAVTVTPPRAGRGADYLVLFRTSAEGALTGGTDTITITFPVGTVVPTQISRQHVRVSDVAVNTGSILVDGRSVTLPVPSGVSIARSTASSVRFLPDAGIVNPPLPGSYWLQIQTSRDPVPQNSVNYTLAALQRVQVRIGVNTAEVNGRQVAIDVPPMIIDGRTMVPLRFVADSFGATVSYDDWSKRITITLDGVTVLLTVNSAAATVDGRAVTLDSPAVVKDGRTLVPIRFVSESLDAKVDWNNTTKTVTIER